MAFWNKDKYTDLSSDYSQEGQGSIGTSLIGVTTKKEDNIYKYADNTDNSVLNTDSRSYAYTNAPVLVFNSAGATVDGADVTNTPQTEITTKKEQAIAQTTDKTSTSGLDLNKLMLYGAIAGVVILILPMGKKVIGKTPLGKVVKKVTKKKAVEE